MKNCIYIYFFCGILLSVTQACSDKTKKYFISGETQGTFYHITWFAADSMVGEREIDSLLSQFELIASLYVDSSELVRINQRSTDSLSNMMKDLLEQSLKYANATEGYFDPTVAPLVKAWGFYRKNDILPDSQTINSIRRCIGFRKFRLVDHYIKFDDSCVHIDLNAIAQGYSVDLLAQFFEKKGIRDYLIEIGGEVRAAGTKPDGKPWIVGIERPTNEPNDPQEVYRKVKLINKSLATSGTTRKFYVKDGIKYSHAINPHTGYPVSHSLLMVTVIAPTCTEADALATAFLVMGRERAKKLIQEKFPFVDAFFIYSDKDGNLLTDMTDGFKKYLIE
ncbi:MAG: FAD:protein FMN transferase [Bacteroidales bacterium]|nr:FAD:protein FMN transferase [Bacteroidales bacterium]